jgi:2-amino-4-hydroxy-6-hydroxymethyldihydropteridine diphosphokinase
MNEPLWRPAYIGVGSNLDNPLKQVRHGIDLLGELPDTLVVLCSGLYRSEPMGPKDQPDFVNAVVAVITKLAPTELLRLMQSVEQRQGRERGANRWGPRTLDLDLLSFSAMEMAGGVLTLPHPGIAERNFVLLPWAEITPQYRVPGLVTVEQLARSISSKDPQIQKME